MLAPAGLQATDRSDPRNQPGEQTAPARGPDRGSPYRRTGPGALRRVDDKERSLGAGLDGARVRNSDGSWAHGASCIEWPKAPSGGKEIKMRRTKINRATGIRAPSVNHQELATVWRPARAHELSSSSRALFKGRGAPWVASPTASGKLVRLTIRCQGEITRGRVEFCPKRRRLEDPPPRRRDVHQP